MGDAEVCDLFWEGWEGPGAGGAPGPSQLGERLGMRGGAEDGHGCPVPLQISRPFRSGDGPWVGLMAGFDGDGAEGGADG